MAARTAEERIALIDAKIAKKKEEIKVLDINGIEFIRKSQP